MIESTKCRIILALMAAAMIGIVFWSSNDWHQKGIRQGMCAVYFMYNSGIAEDVALDTCSSPSVRDMILDQPHVEEWGI